MLVPGRKTAVGGAAAGGLLQRAKQRAAAGATPPNGMSGCDINDNPMVSMIRQMPDENEII